MTTRHVIRECLITTAIALVLLASYFGVKWLMDNDDTKPMAAAMARVAQFPTLKPGSTISAIRSTHAANNVSLLIVLSPTCEVCSRSKPFYERLSAEAERRGIPLYVAVPLPGVSVRYAKAVGLSKGRLIGWEMLGLRPLATPTVAYADATGKISRTWIGWLNTGREAEVLAVMADPDKAVPVPQRPREVLGRSLLSWDDVRELVKSRRVSILSVLSRDAHKFRDYPMKVINIPLDELRLRARDELQRADLQVVDCTMQVDKVCSMAVSRLSELGFTAVGLDDTGMGATQYIAH